ncbi:MarR family winged helix-turn-helix transcriptional regulator [Emticicia sp. C21]|uniref:MarR family winged helix-turn-helix transcriptional regulator n=1 Tax=Emticicia sp. C21 TaxID=2302915 RepID=UPI000E34CC3F|nr:MarR family transcriptional regulator [Emticicia sp. C21]RFS15071.1 MarR family transcriptional regulator [Emticicia sp. C21]
MTEITKETAQESSQNLHQEAIINLMLVSQRVRAKLESLCESENITLSQFNILRILRGVYPGAHPRSEIRKRMIDKSDVTRLIDRLETRSLVKRISAEKDMRHSLTIITIEGIELLERLNLKFPPAHQDILKNFTDNELIKLVQLLQKIV